MGNWIMVGLVWIAAVIGCIVMKKIQPETFWLYLIYALCICMAVTMIAIAQLSAAYAVQAGKQQILNHHYVLMR